MCMAQLILSYMVCNSSYYEHKSFSLYWMNGVFPSDLQIPFVIGLLVNLVLLNLHTNWESYLSNSVRRFRIQFFATGLVSYLFLAASFTVCFSSSISHSGRFQTNLSYVFLLSVCCGYLSLIHFGLIRSKSVRLVVGESDSRKEHLGPSFKFFFNLKFLLFYLIGVLISFYFVQDVLSIVALVLGLFVAFTLKYISLDRSINS